MRGRTRKDKGQVKGRRTERQPRKPKLLTRNSELLKTWGARREILDGWVRKARWKTVKKANLEQGNQMWTKERFIRFQKEKLQ